MLENQGDAEAGRPGLTDRGPGTASMTGVEVPNRWTDPKAAPQHERYLDHAEDPHGDPFRERY